MLTLMCCLAITFADDPVATWSEAIAPGAARNFRELRTNLDVNSETNMNRSKLAGRVDGTRAYIVWTEGLVESPELTCLDLSTRTLMWKIPLSPRTQQILFAERQILIEETSHPPVQKKTLQWYDRDTGQPQTQLSYDALRLVHLWAGKWLVFSHGEIRRADNGELVANAVLPRSGTTLTVDETYLTLEERWEADDQNLALHCIKLGTGQTIARHKLDDVINREGAYLFAANQENAVLELTSWSGLGRALLSINTITGVINWKSSLPIRAPVCFVNSSSPIVSRCYSDGNVPMEASIDVDWNTGGVVLPRDRPSPTSWFEWHTPSETRPIAIRVIDGAVVGWMNNIQGGRAALMSFDASTAELRWSTPVSYVSMTTEWLIELGSTPRYAGFANGDELHIVDTQNGKFSSISASSLDMRPPTPLPRSSWPTELVKNPPAPPISTARYRVVILAAVLLSGWVIVRMLRP